MNPTMLALCLAISCNEVPAASPWRTDYSAAKEEARRTSKPLFVVFR